MACWNFLAMPSALLVASFAMPSVITSARCRPAGGNVISPAIMRGAGSSFSFFWDCGLLGASCTLAADGFLAGRCGADLSGAAVVVLELLSLSQAVRPRLARAAERRQCSFMGKSSASGMVAQQ